MATTLTTAEIFTEARAMGIIRPGYVGTVADIRREVEFALAADEIHHAGVVAAEQRTERWFEDRGVEEPLPYRY